MLAPLVLIAAFAPHVPNITLCNYTIHVHKGCSPSRDWSLVARNVPSDRILTSRLHRHLR